MQRKVFSAVAVFLLYALVATSDGATDDDAPILIKDTGSTNGPGYEFTIYRKHPAICVYDDWARHRQIKRLTFTYGPPEGRSVIPEALLKELYQDVASYMPLSKLQTFGCAKSASFGTSTYIIYKGEESPDIQCLAGEPSKLSKDYRGILNVLRKR